MDAPPTTGSSGRLQALRRYQILDTPPEPSFDHITALAAQLLRVPIALISFVDQDRVWFKSRHGLAISQTGREPGFCVSAIDAREVYHVHDARTDARTASHPLVTGEPRLRFYGAAPLRTSDDFAVGTVCVMDRKPRELHDDERALLTHLATLVVDQLELRRAARESEARFRDLFDEAPIAYVHEDLESRFIRANRAALRILGIKPEEAVGTIGKTLVADTPDNQRRLKEAFQSIGRGTDTGGVVLELRRKDNGAPVWIQWWSRPDPDGQYTRTMFIDITDRVRMERENTRLEAQNVYLQEEIRSAHNFSEVVGRSRALLDVLQQVGQVAPTDSTVLISGETGTGKELIARAIHDGGRRRSQALVKVNCGAISAGLVESELFGHVKGAFTGAVANRDGRFKVADGGTIFLDEVGELPLETQVKLLRVLQEKEFEPIGSSRTIKVDVRVIAATNRDLAEAVAAGSFRRDLYYRLNVLPIRVPPLRERPEDLPLLVAFFLQKLATSLNKPAKYVSEDTMRRLTNYTWPGNIRELQNVLERAVILSADPMLTLSPDFSAGAPGSVAVPVEEKVAPKPLPPSPSLPTASDPSAAPEERSLEDVERRHIESTLARTNWLIEGERGAARILELNPSTLRSRMERLGIKRRDRFDAGPR